MELFKTDSKEANEIKKFVLEDFTPHYGEKPNTKESNPKWERMKELGTDMWLDTGDPAEIAPFWTPEFSALTTNNTLLNKEVQKGTYDELIPRAVELLKSLGDIPAGQMRLELAFILNARHALSLVEQFDAFVSVEEHTQLADQIEAAVIYGRRYYEICPERFYVKVPLTPAGILATRRLSAEGIPVNHTLGFSARQNYVATRIAEPVFVNVFLGRLNSFVEKNRLGPGTFVGERAAVASQCAIRSLREQNGVKTRQIGASLRNGEQVRNLAGLDVLTMPAKAAQPFQESQLPPNEIVDCTDFEYRPELKEGDYPNVVPFSTLWDIPKDLIQTVDMLESEGVDRFTADDLVDFMADRGFDDLFPRWTDVHIKTSRSEGKIPSIRTWKPLLETGKSGLDALMNLAGLNSFAVDQRSMDNHVNDVAS